LPNRHLPAGIFADADDNRAHSRPRISLSADQAPVSLRNFSARIAATPIAVSRIVDGSGMPLLSSVCNVPVLGEPSARAMLMTPKLACAQAEEQGESPSQPPLADRYQWIGSGTPNVTGIVEESFGQPDQKEQFREYPLKEY
jgi:hypothetical protein